MTSRVVYWNGRFVPESEARLSIYDSALVMGDMAFEVTRTCRQVPFRLGEHLDRLWHSLEVLEIDPGLSRAELAEITAETLARNLPSEAADVDWNIIHNVSRGPAGAFVEAFSSVERRPTVLVSCFPLAAKLAALAPAYETGLDLVVPAQRALPGWLQDNSIKTRSRVAFQLANQQAQRLRPGASAVLVDPDGFLTEGTSGNLFVARQGALATPPLDCVLPGVTRGVILELASRLGIATTETPFSPADARGADEVFLSSTSIGILHARSLDGATIGDGRLGPVTRRLREALFAELGLDLAAQARGYASRIG